MLEHAPPPPAIAEFAVANLIRMGFPQRGAEGVIAICACHKEVKAGGGYTCPRCKARVCELPTECRICGLTLVSSPHLARSYHHLFPVTPFNEVPPLPTSKVQQKPPHICFSCQQSIRGSGTKNTLFPYCLSLWLEDFFSFLLRNLCSQIMFYLTSLPLLQCNLILLP